MSGETDQARNELIGWLIAGVEQDHPGWLATQHQRLLIAEGRHPDRAHIFRLMADDLADMAQRIAKVDLR